MFDFDCWFCCDLTEAIPLPNGSVCLDRTDFIPILKSDQSISASYSEALAIYGKRIYVLIGFFTNPSFLLITPKMPLMKRPVIDLSDCILCGVCQDVCPEVFRLSAAGYIEVVEMPDYPRSRVDEAIKNCPADCIVWE